jgi:SAM-dependent methyltransferase
MPTSAIAHRATPLLKGLLTWIPGVQRAFYDRTAAGGTHSPAYCYGVWLKHLALLTRHGMPELPQRVVELGPGGSLGAGLAALLCGAQRYTGVDVVRHASAATTAPVLRELIALLQRRAPRPARGWPDFDDCLDARLFPGSVLTEARLDAALAPRRLAMLEDAVSRMDSPTPHPALRYVTGDRSVVPAGEADLVFSHVVLSLVDDLEGAYREFARWLKPGGWMSHQIDFTSFGVTPEWNGHLKFSDLEWRLVAGHRPFFASRERWSAHVKLMDACGFELVHAYHGHRSDGLRRSQLAARWRSISDEDLSTWGAFFIARKR